MADYKERIIDSSSLHLENNQVDTRLKSSHEDPTNVPPEVKGWLRKIGNDSVTVASVFDDNGQVMLPAQTPTQTKLPLSRTKFLAGFKKKVDDTGRWFSVFLLRIIKKESGNVKFNEE